MDKNERNENGLKQHVGDRSRDRSNNRRNSGDIYERNYEKWEISHLQTPFLSLRGKARYLKHKTRPATNGRVNPSIY